MSFEFEVGFCEYLKSRIQAGVANHAKDAPSYRRMEEIHTNLYELVDEIIDGLPHDEREIMIRYSDNDATIQAENSIVIYKQGMKDCISILRHLGVI